MAEGHAAARLKAYLGNQEVPWRLSEDIKVILEENAALKKQSVDFPERWTKLIDYFQLNDVDVVLHLHSSLSNHYWTCMLWGKTTGWADGDAPEIAMERAFLKSKREANKEAR